MSTAADEAIDTHDSGDGGGDEPVEVRPWWQSPVNLVSVAVAIALLAGALGWVIGNNRALPDPNTTDIGFLQDMRWHHDQAVELAFVFLNDEGTDAGLRTIAEEILVGQSLESGMMIQLLRSFGAAESNETDIAMSWMGTPTPLERMPGMASDTDIAALQVASGVEADRLFVTLMTAHHQGGIHMAQYAAEHAATADVRTMAGQIAGNQAEEIDELASVLARIEG
jgi:uncharacterized protein (DUF305 family)